MDERLWDNLMARLQVERVPARRLCVGCWYKTSRLPFPALESSGLCATCAEETRASYFVQKATHEQGIHA